MKIQNETELQAALKEIEPYFDEGAEPEAGSPEEKRFFELADAIEEYEADL